MKLRKFMCMAVTASIIMTSAAVISMPTASAETVNTTTEFSEDFESYGNLGNVDTLYALDDTGWYMCDHTKLYSPVNPSASPYKGYYKMPEIRTVDNSKVLYIQTPNQTAGESQAKLGYGRYLPGVNDTNKKASGVYEIQFDYKPFLSNGKTQFYFGVNTADGSADNDTNAQHNIMSGRDTNFYIGNRNYQMLYNNNNPIPQGTLPALDIGGVKWYTVKAVVNCDARYYSVELYDRETEKLIARRSPISFAGNENVGFLKFSALGLDGTYAAAVYIDNVSMKKTTIEKTIYEDKFDSYTNDSYRASSGVTIGGSTEDFDGNSYFEGYTPWRALRVGKSAYRDYKLETNGSGNAVRLGDNSETPGTIEKSGLVYMPVGDKLATSETQVIRGKLNTSFVIKPDMIGASGYQVYFTPEYSSTGAKAFEIVNNSDTPAVVTDNGSVTLDASKWYDVDLEFDVMNHLIATTVKEHDLSTAVASFCKSVDTLTAVKGILFNAAGGTSVLMDNVKLAYGGASAKLKYVKKNGQIVSSVGDFKKGEQVTAYLDYINLTESTSKLIMVISCFDDQGRFLGYIQPYSKGLPVGAKQDQAINFTPDIDGEYARVTVCLFDGMENITPYCNALTFSGGE